MKEGESLTEQVTFKILRQIGAGTYGSVYKATQEGIDRTVAIKELKNPDHTHLKKETWIQGRLIHPNIVTVLFFNEKSGYLVMEYVESSLADKIKIFQERKQKFDETRVGEIARGCLDALAFAHEHGCQYHGDIKPGNVLVTEDWQVKVSDFGVARSYRTGPSDLAGSARWAAPETLKGWKESKVWSGDAQSDLFSLGIILYVLLSGTNPFVDVSGIKQPEELILDTDYIPNTPQTTNPIIGKVVAKLLAKEVRSRYKSARDALDDLFQLVQEPLSETPRGIPPSIEQEKKQKQTTKTISKSPEELARLAYDLNSNGDYDDAENIASEAIEKDPTLVAAYQGRGFARSKLRKLPEAIEDFTKALTNTPPWDHQKFGQLFYQRAYTKRLAGDSEGSCKDVRQALQYDPLNPKYNYLRTRVCKD